METISRFFTAPQESFFLFGARGTGKSTWAKTSLPDSLSIDLLRPDVFRSLSARPERLRELIEAHAGQVIVIDEIQKNPSLLPLVHQMIEEKKGYQFVLTGSSSRKLKRAGTDLLAGRALLKTLHPFMSSELGAKFDFSRALQLGLLPLVWSAKNPTEVLKTYIALCIREEVQMEGLVRNIGNFSRFLEAISFSHASLINISNISRECEVERKVVSAYVTILNDLLLSFELPVFTKRAKRKTIVHSKFYLFDAGVFRSLRPRGPLDKPEEIEGSALEGLVAQHLFAWKSYRNRQEQLFFWRTRKGLEVDFILYGPDCFFAIEVKNSNTVRPEDLRSLKTFLSDYPESTCVLLNRGKERLKRNGIYCIPCEPFLRGLDPRKKLHL
jgi:uncharacterized protein